MASPSIPEINDDFLLQVMEEHLSLIKREVKIAESRPRTNLQELVKERLRRNRPYSAHEFCTFLEKVCFTFSCSCMFFFSLHFKHCFQLLKIV